MTNHFFTTTAKILLVQICISSLVMTATISTPGYAKESDAVIPVNIIRPVKRTMELFTEITGELESSERSTFGAKVAGSLVKIDADEGDRVKRGAVLALVDPADYELSLKLTRLKLETAKTGVSRAKLEVRRSKVNLHTMETDLKRIKGVFDKGSFPKQRVDHAKNAYESAAAVHAQAKVAENEAGNQVSLLEIQVKIAEKKVADCRIRAPFEGVITKRHASVGEWMSTGKSVFTIDSDNPIEIKGHISEKFIGKLSIGMPVRVTIDGVSAFCPQHEIGCEAVVSEIAPVADAKRGTVELTIRMPNEDFRFKPGLYARLQVILNRSQDTLAIPKTCILYEKNQTYVFIINDDKAHRREIQTGIVQGEMIEVISGLESGAKIVSAGQNQLKDNKKVNILNEKEAM